MKVAVEGCCHGELDKIYETIQYLEKKNAIKVDLLLICGDFQAVRNHSDLQCMAVPPKYQRLNTFYKYYSGEKTAPVLTIFIGGNHEASNYLQELPYGGWVAPNIYYMGYGCVVQFGGLRIAGMSGIYKSKDFAKGHYERPPYTDYSKRSVYHIRNFEVFRFKQIARPIDIFLSHDWPRGIYNYGNVGELLRKKSFFQKEIENNCLGSVPAEELLYRLKPQYWFSAHLHVKFAALIQHQPEAESSVSKTTKFLALDKCLPKRKFLQILDIPHQSSKPMKLQLDPEWLAILKSTNHLLHLGQTSRYMPGPGSSERWDFQVTDEEIESIKEDFGGDLTLPENFEKTVPAHDSSVNKSQNGPNLVVNPQTTLLCTMLDVTDPNAVFLGKDSSFSLDTSSCTEMMANPDEIDVDDEDDDVDDSISSDINSSMDTSYSDSFSTAAGETSLDDSSLACCNISSLSNNPEETSLDNNEDDDELKMLVLAQKEAQETPLGNGHSMPRNQSEISLEDDDDELESILAAQKKHRNANEPVTSSPLCTKSSSQLDIGIPAPLDTLTCMSPADKESQDEDQSMTSSLEDDKDVLSADSLPSPSGNSSSRGHSEDEGTSVVSKASKRGENSENEISPQSKKLRRRNQILYIEMEEDGK